MTNYTSTVGDQQNTRWASYPKQITAALDEAKNYIDQGYFSDAHNILDPLVLDGNAEAAFLASGISRKNESLDAFEKRRVELLKFAAAQDYPPALYAMGAILDETEDERSRKEAAELFRRAALRGHAHSQWIHGICLLYGSGGFEKNESLGIELISSSADAGFVGALRTMTEILEKGKFGVTRDPTRAEHLRKLALGSNVIDY